MIQSFIDVLTISPYVTLAAVFFIVAIALSALNGLIDIATALAVVFALIFGVLAIFHFIYTGGLSSILSVVVLSALNTKKINIKKQNTVHKTNE